MCLFDSQGFFLLECHSGGLLCLEGRVKVGLNKCSEKGHGAAVACALSVYTRTRVMTHMIKNPDEMTHESNKFF